MPKERQTKKKSKRLLAAISITLAILLAIGIVLVSAANAGKNLKDTTSIGIGSTRYSTEGQIGVIASTEYELPEHFESANTALATYSTRDISTALSVIAYQIEAATKAAAEAARAQEMIEANIAKNNRNEHARNFGMPPNLEEVN